MAKKYLERQPSGPLKDEIERSRLRPGTPEEKTAQAYATARAMRRGRPRHAKGGSDPHGN